MGLIVRHGSDKDDNSRRHNFPARTDSRSNRELRNQSGVGARGDRRRPFRRTQGSIAGRLLRGAPRSEGVRPGPSIDRLTGSDEVLSVRTTVARFGGQQFVDHEPALTGLLKSDPAKVKPNLGPMWVQNCPNSG